MDTFLTIKQLAQELRSPDEPIETVIRRIRLYKEAGIIPYYQIIKGGVIRFRLSEVCETLKKEVARPLSQDYNLSRSQKL